MRSLPASLSLFLALCAAAPVCGKDQAFQFGVIGDMPYTKVEEVQFSNLLKEINRAPLAFVVHVGDMQVDARFYENYKDKLTKPCNDGYDAWMLAKFQSIDHPVIVTPGDNDWTDCHFLGTPESEPLVRLAAVRRTFFPSGKSLGRTTTEVESQGSVPEFALFTENRRWSVGSVTFATLHIVGSSDNAGRTPQMDEEQRARKAANIAWLREAFAQARKRTSGGLVLFMQANPQFENSWPEGQRSLYMSMVSDGDAPDPPPKSAFSDYVAALAEELEMFDRPVLLVHGDTHRFRVDHPLFSRKTNRRFENLLRVETYGSPDIHWVRITVDPSLPQLFRIEPQIVSDNVMSRHSAK